MAKRKSLVEERFGRLVVLSQTKCPEGIHKRRYWVCQCDCGNTCVTSGRLLVSGLKKSCGCLRNDVNRERHYVHPATLSRRNSSGVIGVSYDKQCKKWRAQLYHNGKHYYLGVYKEKADAVKARRMAEEKFNIYSADHKISGESE